MQKFHHLRALALLGALILYFFLWPICCCAARPTQRPFSMQMSEDAAFKSNVTLSNQTYRKLMTKNKIDDNQSTNDNLVTALSNNISAAVTINNPVLIEAASVNAATESDSTNIYELFDLRKGKRKIVSSHQVLSRTDRSVHLNSSNSKNNSVSGAKRVKNKTKLSTLERNERSANLSHITGSARKIQLYIKNRFLQLLPDGVVNGTTDEQSDYTILQRTTVNVGQIKIQGVATCLFLCMNSCGTTFGSAEFTDDCIFNESMEQHHYNTYSSTYHSNAKRKLYLGLNRHGQPRKIQLPATRQLGKLATYTKSLTQTVAHERVEQLIGRLYGANHVRHGLKQLCDTGRILKNIASGLRGNPKCNNNLAKPNRKKKKKRKCREDEPEGDQCVKATSISIQPNINNSITHSNKKKIAPASQSQQQKKCDDCKVNKKKPTKKNNQAKSTSNNANKGSKTKAKGRTTKAVTRMTTTPRPEDEIDQDVGRDDAFTSEELEEEEDYDEMNAAGAGHSINLVDDNDPDDYHN